MSSQHERILQDEEEEYISSAQATTTRTPSPWKVLWQSNKGMFLILLSEIAGSSMDAIVRFLQQGGQGMHPLQVRSRSYKWLWAGVDTGRLSLHE